MIYLRCTPPPSPTIIPFLALSLALHQRPNAQLPASASNPPSAHILPISFQQPQIHLGMHKNACTDACLRQLNCINAPHSHVYEDIQTVCVCVHSNFVYHLLKVIFHLTHH